MAIWRKVIVSGSAANLSSLQVDNLLNGVVTGSSNGTLGIQAINGTGNIVATINATGLVHSGSFSGSYTGTLTGTASFATSASFAATSSLPLLGIVTASVSVSTITFTKGDGSTFPITVLQSGSAASANSVLISNTNTGIYYPTFVISGSSSQSLSVNSASFSYNAATNTLNVTSSFITSSNVFGPFGANSVSSASYAATASVATSASFATTASFALNVTPIATGSFATTGSNTFIGNQIISGTLTVVTGSGIEFQVLGTGVKIGNIITDVHTVTGSLNVSGSVTAVGFSGSLFGTASWATSASSAISSAFASTAASANSLANALTFGTGLSGSAATYNGSTAVNVAISGSATLTTGNHPKWSGTGFVNSLISDNGTTITLASASVISAGGINVTGNSTFQNNLTVQGDLAVNGTTTFINTTNTYIRDQFLTLFSGSNALGDGGIIIQYATGSGGVPTGSAFYLESTSTSTFGRWAVASGVAGNATAVTADEYMVTAKISPNANPSNAAPPTWGGSVNGSGNIWIKDDTGDIFIYA